MEIYIIFWRRQPAGSWACLLSKAFLSGDWNRIPVRPPYGRLTRATSGTGWKPVGTSDGMGI